MSAFALILVVSSGLLHATWNLFAKQSADKIAFLWLAQAVAASAFLPLAFLEAGSFPWNKPAFFYLASSMALHGIYVVLLAYAYRAGDLSVVYPLMRGTGPLLVPLFGVLTLHETMELPDAAGAALVVVGIVILGGWPLGEKYTDSSNVKAFWIAACVGVMVAAYTITDKLAMERGGIPPVTLNAASNIGNWLFLAAFALRGGGTAREWKRNRIKIIIGGVLASGGYTLFLFAMKHAPVAQLAPMREIGTVFGTLFGIFLLRERQGLRRLGASAMITAGVILLGI